MRSLATNSKGTSFRTGVMRIGGGIPGPCMTLAPLAPLTDHRRIPCPVLRVMPQQTPPAESLWMPILEHALHCIATRW